MIDQSSNNSLESKFGMINNLKNKAIEVLRNTSLELEDAS